MSPEDEAPALEKSDAPPTADIELFREPEPDTEPPVEVAVESRAPEARAPESRAPESRAPESRAPGRTGPPPRPLRIIGVAGAKGGVGKTLLVTNLALYLATIGRKVVVVDADAGGANIHTFLGVPRPGGLAHYDPPMPSFAALAPGPSEEHDDALVEPLGPSGEPASKLARDSEPPEAEPDEPVPAPGEPVETPMPGLRLLHAGIDEPVEGQRRPMARSRLMARLRDLEAEYVVVDLGSGTQPALLDLWLDSDLRLYVTLPEPTAVENTYRFARAVFARYLRRGAEPDVRRALVERLRALGNHPAPLDLARQLEADGDPLAGRVRRAMADFAFHFVLNQTRVRADLELGDWMRTAALRRLGLHFDYLGYIDYDDTVWSCVRSRRPVLVESPGTKASRSIEKIARRLLAIDSGKARSRPLRAVPPDTHHDLLEVDRGATDEEIRRAYKRAREVYALDALSRYGLFDDAGLEALQARLEEAYDVLLDPARRRPYELSVFPPEPDPADEPVTTRDRSEPLPPPPRITPETDFTGALLRAVRESKGIELRAVSQRTKIGAAFLVAIEEDDFRALPALVYVRGFVTEVAKFLDLDTDHVSRTYVRRYRRYVEEREKL